MIEINRLRWNFAFDRAKAKAALLNEKEVCLLLKKCFEDLKNGNLKRVL